MNRIHEILKTYWGYDTFRPLQEDIVNSILAGQDTLALLPTGGGKSVCFQVPALAMEGLCLVISPLIALMKDQVENLNKRDIPAVAIFSGLSRRQIILELDNAVNGKYRFLYLSPERLQSEMFRERLPHMKISFLAVDEAHCISQWGYDFRPEYLKIAEIRELVHKPVLALTATATAGVVKDIQQKLGFREERVYRKSFERKNLSYVVLKEENKEGRMLKICRRIPGTGIIYARNRRLTVDLARFLSSQGESVDFYHAGLDNKERSRKQDNWVSGRTRIMIATNAFGMGIDKPEVRFVVHYEMPDSLEAYYQEAGRAGRDEKKSWCVLLYMEKDAEQAEERLRKSFPSYKEIRQVYEFLFSYLRIAVDSGAGVATDFDLADFSDKYKLPPADVFRAVKILEQHEILFLSDAFYRPSNLRFTVDHTTLYDFELRNPQIALLIKTLLRTYGGLFDHYSSIKEEQIARMLGTTATSVSEALEKLARAGLLDYQKASDKPTITILRDRENKLFLNTAFLKAREETAKRKLDAVIQYASGELRCRSQILMEYFDDLDSAPCGQCDICLALKKEQIAENEFIYYRNHIRSVLSEGAGSVQEIVAGEGVQHEQKILSVIRVLLDEGFLHYSKEGQLEWAKE